jgi:ABC-type sugar transport system substrate-binding protein
MQRLRVVLPVLVALLALALGATACGGDDDDGGGGGGGSGGGGGGGGSQVADVKFTSIETKVPEGYEEPEPGKLRLGFLNPLRANEFLNTMGRAMKLETERLGGELIELDAAGDVDKQVNQFNQLIAQNLDGIGVFALDPGSVAPGVQRAKAAGIPLVTIDLNFESTTDIGGFDSQIWQRRDEAAYIGAQEMASQLGGEGEVATIDFAVKVPSIVYSVDRGKFWAEKFGLTVPGNASNPSDDIAGGEKAMTQLIGEFPDMRGVIGYNDPSAIGAASAARSQGLTDLAFGGQNGGSDALEAIRAGRLTYSAKLDPPSMGKAFAWGLYNLSQGKKVPKTVKAGPPKLVTEENVDEVTPWDEELKAEYGGG